MKIVGVDLSLTGTGIAVIEWKYAVGWNTTVETFLIKSKPCGDSFKSRHLRLETIAASVVGYCKGADMVVIEGPSYGSVGGSAFDRAGLWWWVASILFTVGTPVAVVTPTQLKKWATGKGNAGKTEVVVAINKLWPTVETNNDNESDALCLATMGVQSMRLGNVPSRAHHEEMIRRVSWPN